MRAIKIVFWKIVALIYDYRPKNYPYHFNDYPWAWRWDYGEEEIQYPKSIKILYEWKKAGKHWIIFTR